MRCSHPTGRSPLKEQPHPYPNSLEMEHNDFEDRNPHKSHQSNIACTVCHKGHVESRLDCPGCHPKFRMESRDAAKPF
jgi:uncharacterized paraquat-inducible protein A